ncbi:hypothetical protein D2Q93_10495 [Alicyclobacillaceae bacterium I2511]|jgi:hypothetical protein|nr:hypothetical protein D2Q93_10495 [Alicyclobacillaceae bacterium I2511]
MMDKLKDLAIQNKRVEFLLDDVANALYENDNSGEWILEELGIGIICTAGTLDDALVCVEDNSYGGVIQVLK